MSGIIGKKSVRRLLPRLAWILAVPWLHGGCAGQSTDRDSSFRNEVAILRRHRQATSEEARFSMNKETCGFGVRGAERLLREIQRLPNQSILILCADKGDRFWDDVPNTIVDRYEQLCRTNDLVEVSPVVGDLARTDVVVVRWVDSPQGEPNPYTARYFLDGKPYGCGIAAFERVVQDILARGGRKFVIPVGSPYINAAGIESGASFIPGMVTPFYGRMKEALYRNCAVSPAVYTRR